MLNTTLPRLRCPSCREALHLASASKKSGSAELFEVTSGELECSDCRQRFPILAGVAILVPDPREYILSHVKGIAQVVPDSEVPKSVRRDYLAAKSEIEAGHIEDCLLYTSPSPRD